MRTHGKTGWVALLLLAAAAAPAMAQKKAAADATDAADADAADAEEADEAEEAEATAPAVRPPAPTRPEDPRASADGIFHGDKLDDEDSIGGTLWQGSLTSTSFIYTESADASEPLTGGAVGAEQASPYARYFTDLRAQIDGKHLFGGRWDVRLDGRVRVARPPEEGALVSQPQPIRTQSGTFGDNEYELRELYVVRGGESSDLFVGRQQVLDLAAIKIDGVRLVYSLGKRWNAFALAGLYPARSSRSLDSDYVGVDATTGASVAVYPVAAGAGAAYRTQQAYGSVGVGGILPLGDDIVTGDAETTRVFATAQGYTRLGQKLDAYHYLVVDFAGADGFAITNGSVGLDWNPQPRLHVTGAFHRVDTETLNVQAQALLEDPNPVEGLVQNNVQVLRIASDQARLGVSAALGQQQRFELSVQGALRRRGDIEVPSGAMATTTIPAAQGGEVTFQAVDRRSILGLRLTGSVGRFFPIGDVSYHKAESLMARLAVAREFAGGRGEWELEAGYLYTQDQERDTACATPMVLTCYGSAKLGAPSAGGLLFYRFATDWYGFASAWASTQSLTINDAGTDESQPAILTLSGLLRIAYRF
jgi:hypothetical protein